jgi:hypothetical protein
MLASHDERELDILVARAFDDALAQARRHEERFELIQRFGKLSRLLALHPLRTKIFLALREGRGSSFQDIAGLVEQLRPARRWVPRNAAFLATPKGETALLSPGEVARELGVSAKTVANWCKKGLLECVTLDSGHRRIPERAMRAYRQSLAHWESLDAAAARARGGEAAPGDEEVFAEFMRQEGDSAR